MDIITRRRLLNQLTSLLGSGMMLILVGQRRVGKTYLLLQLKDWLAENRPQANVLHIDKDSMEFDDITDAKTLYRRTKDVLPENGDNYLLIDEVQNIENYEDALRSLYSERRCQIIATGSNAYLFSSEISTRLSGRYIEIPVYSLTYPEFLEFHKLTDSPDALLTYLRIGGLPGLANLDIKTPAAIRQYLEGVYSTIVLKDILMREGLRNGGLMRKLSQFTADSVGKMVSPNSIANALNAQGEKTSQAAVSKYLDMLCNALLTVAVPRYDIHGKRLFESLGKYYFADIGIRNFLAPGRQIDSIERVMENAVWHHLVTQGYKVYVGILYNSEIDFVATRGEERMFIQVTYQLATEETKKREFGNLLAIRDASPKYVISMEPLSGEYESYPGIQHLNLRDFLKKEF